MIPLPNYEIIATLGPSSQSEALWRAMLGSGVTAFRLNSSHLSLSQLDTWLEKLNAFHTASLIKFHLVLDLQGSKWRLGEFNSIELEEGQTISLVHSSATDQPLILPVPHTDFFKAAQSSDGEIILNDAKSRLKIESSNSDGLRARVIKGGLISAHKGITLSGCDFRVESLSEKDQAILARTRSSDMIRYAISYVRDAEEMRRYRELFGTSAYLISKIERAPALEDAQAIASLSNEVWLCRGDLGAEVGLVHMAEATHGFRGKFTVNHPPLIMAGQVLEHMTEHPTPTRSEICYLYDTLRDGYQGFVLSDETAIGKFPLEACQIASQFKTG